MFDFRFTKSELMPRAKQLKNEVPNNFHVRPWSIFLVDLRVSNLIMRGMRNFHRNSISLFFFYGLINCQYALPAETLNSPCARNASVAALHEAALIASDLGKLGDVSLSLDSVYLLGTKPQSASLTSYIYIIEIRTGLAELEKLKFVGQFVGMTGTRICKGDAERTQLTALELRESFFPAKNERGYCRNPWDDSYRLQDFKDSARIP